jgi:hypothetical protein
MAKYLLSIYADESQWPKMSEEEVGQLMKAYRAFGEEVEKAGVFVAGDALAPTATAKTVRVRDGKSGITDGPFAETKEQLGGFYLLECKDEAEATEWAAKIPDAMTGSIEVRPVMDYPDEQ